MTWTERLEFDIDHAFKSVDGLMAKVDEKNLGWKPPSGDNWWTTAQLLNHLGESCGQLCRGFLTGDWGLPEGVKLEDMSMEEMLPPAEAMASVESVAQARERLAADRALALAMVREAGEDKLASQPAPAPWDPTPMPLGQRFGRMVSHLEHHKCQLFYYLKQQGVPVNTMDMYGMG